MKPNRDTRHKMQSNYILITLDSCRWDVFQSAAILDLRDSFNFKESWSHGTYTLPSHISMLQGILPHCPDDIPLYNRFNKQLLYIEGSKKKKRKHHLSFPFGTRSIVSGFNSLGYKTISIGAVGWFKSEVITSDFAISKYTGIEIENQVNEIESFIKDSGSDPYFLLWNIGETHDPFEFGGYIDEINSLREMQRNKQRYNKKVANSLFEKQISCIEYVESYIVNVLEMATRNGNKCMTVICSDHGTCFGEDNCFGHGFYHPNVQRVPMGIGLVG